MFTVLLFITTQSCTQLKCPQLVKTNFGTAMQWHTIQQQELLTNAIHARTANIVG